MKTIDHSPEDITLFKNKALQWAASFETASYFDSNSYSDPYSKFDVLITAGAQNSVQSVTTDAFKDLESFQNRKTWSIGFLGYDLKNSIENLNSENPDFLGFPDLFFFEPTHLIEIKGEKAVIHSASPLEILKDIETIRVEPSNTAFSASIEARFTYPEYLETVEQIKSSIKRGDIYEMNFCQEFYSKNTEINPLGAFLALNEISPTPFATFLKFSGKYIISATPERFLKKEGKKLISQPIKGTVKRSGDESEDQQRRMMLKNNLKERSENVMIVDLVRNDLTRCSVPGTVKVEELFGIYSFKQVHQMISTVTSIADPDLSNVEIIKQVFPMGSMTGAPKIRAMELIEHFEKSKRGIFSGAVGYFSPDGDFDFNVVIRTILYDSSSRYLSFQVGSAITYASDAEKEYEECLIKAEAIRTVLGHSF